MEDGALYRWKGLYFLMLLAQAPLVSKPSAPKLPWP